MVKVALITKEEERVCDDCWQRDDGMVRGEAEEVWLGKGSKIRNRVEKRAEDRVEKVM